MTLHQRFHALLVQLRSFVGRLWYPPLIAALAGIDAYILVIPMDGILISSAMLLPKRWFGFAIPVAIGSTIGSFSLAILVSYFGAPFVEAHFADLLTSSWWQSTQQFFNEYGLWVVFLIGLTPVVQQPAAILAGLTHTNLFNFFCVLMLGRIIKYILLAYVASHAPGLLTKLKIFRGEMDEAGVFDSKQKG